MTFCPDRLTAFGSICGRGSDSKVNPDVLLLLISLADEWEGKITGASQGGPACCPATQALPSSPPQLRQPWQIRGEAVSGVRLSAGLHVASACQTTRRQSRQVDTFTGCWFSTEGSDRPMISNFTFISVTGVWSQNGGGIPYKHLSKNWVSDRHPVTTFTAHYSSVFPP